MKILRLSWPVLVVALVAAGAAGARALAPPSNTSPPTISGTAREGETLTASSGSWSGSTPMSFAYRWQRCNSSGGSCAAIGGANRQTYTLTGSDVGRTLRVTVTATNSDGSASATSAPTGQVAKGQPPQNTAAPSISGTLREGEVLTGSRGSWSSTTPIRYEYRWRRCDQNGNNCDRVGDQLTYRLRRADVGHRMQFHVEAKNSFGASEASALSGTVAAHANAPVNTSAPTLSGNARAGDTLTGNAGAWTGAQRITFTYRMLRCDANGARCVRVDDDPQYTLSDADVGARMRFEVTARNDYGTTVALSAPTGIVTGRGPALRSAPTIIGTARVGQTLTAQSGSWAGSGPITFTYQWLRCDAAGANCIGTGSGAQYRLAAGDVGRRMRVEVTARNSLGTSRATSAPTAVVAQAATAPRSISVTEVQPGNRLIPADIKFIPTIVRSRNPFLMRVRVRDTRGLPVRDALVYVIGLPYGRIFNVPEVATDADGWATLTLRPTRRLPLIRGGKLVLFVRARKGGDNLLAGVSSRRLVQVRLGPPG